MYIKHDMLVGVLIVSLCLYNPNCTPVASHKMRLLAVFASLLVYIHSLGSVLASNHGLEHPAQIAPKVVIISMV